MHVVSTYDIRIARPYNLASTLDFDNLTIESLFKSIRKKIYIVRRSRGNEREGAIFTD